MLLSDINSGKVSSASHSSQEMDVHNEISNTCDR